MDCNRSAAHTPATTCTRLVLVAVATYLAVVSVGHANEPGVAHPGLADARRDAMAAAAELNTQLRGQLQSTLKSGGAVGAVAACSTIAPAVTAEVTKPTLTVKRTALRVRNENNAADDFELRVLSAFVAKTAAGADPASLVHEEVVATPQGPAFRFMKAIPMADQPCATCHGKSIAPDVAAEVKRLYPRDEAVGFEAGQIRGAISVIRQLP
ncbi:MAG: DUF3365 domain-containing protein [Verrucomicrobiae bacterium]|nr:DUF3365 domain-containing protein [Verrucomicrobiae bacterium]